MPGYRKKRQSLARRIGKKFLEWQQVSLKKGSNSLENSERLRAQ